MSPHDRLLLLIDNLRGNREFRLVDADLSALIDIDARITWLEAENARLREFVRYVLYDYLEVDNQTQCPWCLWVPGRSYEPIHECDVVEMMRMVGPRAALQEETK